MGVPSISSSSNVNPKLLHDPALAETPVQLFIGRGNLYGFLSEDNSGSDVFIQMFDAADVGDITLGVTVADMTCRVPASGKFGKDANDTPFKFFSKGCVVVVTSTRTGSGAPGAPSTSSFWYMNMKTFG
jgi:hypothetical protein